MEKEIEIERIKKLEMRLKKLKVSKTIVNAVGKLVISEKYLYHILNHEKLCLTEDIKTDKLKNNITLVKGLIVYVILHYKAL